MSPSLFSLVSRAYPDRPDLREMHAQLPSGWLAATNLNNQVKITIIRAATEVARLTFGSDFIFDF